MNIFVPYADFRFRDLPNPQFLYVDDLKQTEQSLEQVKQADLEELSGGTMGLVKFVVLFELATTYL